LPLIEIMQRHHGRCHSQMLHQSTTMTGIFCRNHIRRPQGLDGPLADITQIAQRCCNYIKGSLSRHETASSVYLSVKLNARVRTPARLIPAIANSGHQHRKTIMLRSSLSASFLCLALLSGCSTLTTPDAETTPQATEAVQAERLLQQALQSQEPTRSQDRKSTRLNSSHVKISYAV